MGAATPPPPRGRQDLHCVNCSEKGHTAAECCKPIVDKDKRPCFICKQVGHVATRCPKKPAGQARIADGDFGGQNIGDEKAMAIYDQGNGKSRQNQIVRNIEND